MVNFLWGVVLALASAWFCYFVAARNEMSKIGWPILGFLFPLIGAFITLAVAFMKQKDTV